MEIKYKVSPRPGINGTKRYEAFHGKRRVEVAMCVDGKWLIHRWVNDRMVREKPNQPTMHYEMAIGEATKFLLSTEEVECWPKPIRNQFTMPRWRT